MKSSNLRGGILVAVLILLSSALTTLGQSVYRSNFNRDWKFNLGDQAEASKETFKDDSWRKLNLPHDWSIEGKFDKNNPAGVGGGALPGGIGWYRKTFTMPASARDKSVFLDFDGIYCNSEVWINGHFLGERPNGYISFRYDISPYLHYGNAKNIVAVRVNNAEQPNSRWYSGSGIYRNVWLTVTGKIHVEYNGTYINTPEIRKGKAKIHIQVKIQDSESGNPNAIIKTGIVDASGKQVASFSSKQSLQSGGATIIQNGNIVAPHLWSLNDPYLYKAVTSIIIDGREQDRYETVFGIRSFRFDVDQGFFLNGKHVKIRGVCDHHDLGCLGSAINTRALERQLQILKGMGCNGIRTSHNPPAPELLQLCDKMGFVVMDEAFDMWAQGKNKYDYHLAWKEWHARDLADQVQRDRNHPSVIMWSLGNEIPEQWSKDSVGMNIIRELVAIVKGLDTTRPTVTANNEVGQWNQILQAGALDLIGYNYHHQNWNRKAFETWGRKPLIITESISALETRGHYDMPSDSIRRWPERWDKPFLEGNPDFTVSAYDNVSAPWGSTHEETMRVFEPNDFISGMFIWTGFDYLGEPTPYLWPARSSYFGIVDLAGFPKDIYYMYKSVWTRQPVLHIFPHWNWKEGDTVDIWAYYNNSDEVELFLNGKSLGSRSKNDTSFHVMWRVPYKPGTLKAVSRKAGRTVLSTETHTAGHPAKMQLLADRQAIRADGNDLSFVQVRITDKSANLVPDAQNLVKFEVSGGGTIVGVDNGSETSMESFKDSKRKAFNGLCLVVIQSNGRKENIRLRASSEGLPSSELTIISK